MVHYQECTLSLQDSRFSTSTYSALMSSSFTVTISDLRAGITYCYRSEVVNAGTIVGFENDRMFTTLSLIPPPAMIVIVPY